MVGWKIQVVRRFKGNTLRHFPQTSVESTLALSSFYSNDRRNTAGIDKISTNRFIPRWPAYFSGRVAFGFPYKAVAPTGKIEFSFSLTRRGFLWTRQWRALRDSQTPLVFAFFDQRERRASIKAYAGKVIYENEKGIVVEFDARPVHLDTGNAHT